MISYNLSKPMSYEQFKALPQKTQAEYLTDLLVIHGGSNISIGEMLGISNCAVASLRKRLGITVETRTARRSAKELEAWGKFIAQRSNDQPEEIDQPEECAEEPAPTPPRFAPDFFTAQFHCTPAQLTAWMHENLKHEAGNAIYEFSITYRAEK